MNTKRDWVTASEIASFSYCPESWRLGNGLELKPSNQPEKDKGVAQHTQWQQQERRSGLLLRVAAWLFAGALLFWIIRSLMQ